MAEACLVAALVCVAWQVGRLATAVNALYVEMTTERWERGRKERLSPDVERRHDGTEPFEG